MMAWRTGFLRRVDRPDALLLAIGLAVLAAVGWFASPFGVALVIGSQLVIGGIGGVWLVGPVRARYGFARYGTPAVAAVAATLVGRLLSGPIQLAAIPVVATLLLGVIWAEIHLPAGRAPRLAIDLALVGIVFSVAAGLAVALPRLPWPPSLVLVLVATSLPAMRAAELRGRYGIEAIGQAALHLLAVAQLGAVLALLHLPGVLAPAILALGFHAWSGAAESLDAGAPTRSTVVEFGTLAILGILVAILLYGR